MGEIILETQIRREKEYLYYCTKNDDGFLCIGKAKMKRGRTKKNKEAEK